MLQEGGTKMTNEKLRSAQFIFFLYVFISSLLIFIFKFIFPGSAAPLLIFSGEWRVLQAALALFDFFPALAFSALVVPFGLASFEQQYPSFSQVLFKRLMPSIFIAIIASVIYGAIFFLALPLVKNHEDDLRFRGELYNHAKEHAQLRSRAGEWHEALQFLEICDQIWPNSPEMAALRIDIEVNLSEMRHAQNEERSLARAALAREQRSAEFSALSGNQHPLTATQAISMSETAFSERRFFDAHWLASIGRRLAVPGSPDAANAARLASNAWNQISSQSPNRREERLFELFEMKVSGYQAMNSGDWIRAFYIFQELLALTPDDPDVANFLAVSERGTLEYAFFMDEMQLTLGEILTGAVFSLPGQTGRAVARFSNISTFPDFAFGMGFEYMEFNALSRPLVSLRAPYTKLLPVTINGKPQVMVITHALTRNNQDLFWKCEWLIGERARTAVVLDISYEDFLLIALVRRGLPNLQIDNLYLASQRLGSAGYISEIFEAEILNRVGSTVFFLPMSIFVIVIGWRYRARTKPRYLFVLLLPVLPMVFHSFTFMYRSILNTVGIWLVLSMGFAAALAVYIVTLALSLFISLVVLSAQHGN
jgi:hypothetical protein